MNVYKRHGCKPFHKFYAIELSVQIIGMVAGFYLKSNKLEPLQKTANYLI